MRLIRFGCFFDAPPDQWHLGLECIAELMDWGAVLVVDIIQRINNEVFNRPTPMAAIKKTLKKEAKLLQICTKAYATLPTEKKTVSKLWDGQNGLQDEAFCYNSNAGWRPQPIFQVAVQNLPHLQGWS